MSPAARLSECRSLMRQLCAALTAASEAGFVVEADVSALDVSTFASERKTLRYQGRVDLLEPVKEEEILF